MFRLWLEALTVGGASLEDTSLLLSVDGTLSKSRKLQIRSLLFQSQCWKLSFLDSLDRPKPLLFGSSVGQKLRPYDELRILIGAKSFSMFLLKSFVLPPQLFIFWPKPFY